MSAADWPPLLQPVHPLSLTAAGCSSFWRYSYRPAFSPKHSTQLFSLLLSFPIPQQLQTSSDSPSNLVCQACLRLGSHLVLLWLVYFDLIKMHPSRTLGTLLTARLAEPLISAVLPRCFLYAWNNLLQLQRAT